MTQQQVQRSPLPGGLQQMSPLSLVSHGATQNPHHRLLSNQQMLLPNSMNEIEQRMIEYFKLLQQTPKEAARKLRFANKNYCNSPIQLNYKKYDQTFLPF